MEPEHRPEVQLKYPRRYRTVGTVLLCIFVGQSFARFSFGLLLPAMKTDLKIGFGLSGWLGTINLAGYLLGTIITTISSTRIASHRLMQSGTILACAGISILAATRSTPLLLAGMLLGGIGGALAWVPAPQICASVFPPHRRGFAMGMSSGSLGAGIVVSVLLTNAIRRIRHDPGTWRQIWLVEALVGVVAAICSLVFLKAPPTATGSPPKISVLRTVPRWWAPTLAYMCFGVGYVLCTTYIVAMLTTDAHFGPVHAANTFALMGTGNTVGALGVGRLSDSLGRRWTMMGAFTIAGLSCSLVLLGAEPVVSIATFVFGCAMAGAVVSIASYIGDNVRPQDFGSAFGVTTAAFGFAQMLGPRLGGWMRDRTGSFTQVFITAAIAWLVGAMLSAFAVPDKKPGKRKRPVTAGMRRTAR